MHHGQGSARALHIKPVLPKGAVSWRVDAATHSQLDRRAPRREGVRPSVAAQQHGQAACECHATSCVALRVVLSRVAPTFEPNKATDCLMLAVFFWLFIRVSNDFYYFLISSHYISICFYCPLFVWYVVIITRFWNPPALLGSQGVHRPSRCRDL